MERKPALNSWLCAFVDKDDVKYDSLLQSLVAT